MNEILDSISDLFKKGQLTQDSHCFDLCLKERGVITSLSKGMAKVKGLPGVAYEELLIFSNDIYGMAFSIEEEEIGVVLLVDSINLRIGDEVSRTGRLLDIMVGEELIGRIIDPLGFPLDGKDLLNCSKRYPLERPAPAIRDRLPVTVPLQTGLKVIDALIPIGRGQRELIMGDRQTGKTAVALDTILNQKNKNVLCIYCAIGQHSSSVAKVVGYLRDNEALSFTIIIVTEGHQLPGLQYIAPYAATSIAEYFMEKGRDVLVVYDDLTNHARAYRELSLLQRRPPGREAFPGDIFYIHSRLLERSTHLKNELGGGSLTALPVVETEAQNISAYIPTNLISITDGQLYLSPTLFELGILPAIDVGKSVSRVGGKAQLKIYNELAGNLKLAYSQFEELENFSRFGTRLDDHTKQVIEHGKRIRSCLKQNESQPLEVDEQIVILFILIEGGFDLIPLDKIKEVEGLLLKSWKDFTGDFKKQLIAGTNVSDENRKAILDFANPILKSYQVSYE